MTDGTELAVVEHSSPPLTVFGTDNPAAIVERVTAIAKPLADFIKQQGMSSNISGREYVLAEGWAFMGAMLGVAPRAVSVTDLRDAEGRVCGFEANVELRTRDGSIVGGAIAECSRYEEHWSWEPHNKYGERIAARDDFALKSMAQTRATGKAYRMAFGFVMKAAGYEATPAEEMPAQHEQRPLSGDVIDPPKARAATGEINDVGKLLTWALNEHGLSRPQVFGILKVEKPGEITDFANAQAGILLAVSGGRG